LIDLADEVAYNAADLDDAFSAGLLTGAQIAESVAGYARILDELECISRGIRTGAISGIATAGDRPVGDGADRRHGAGGAQSGARDVEEVRRQPGRIAAFTPETLAANREVKSVLHDAVYTSEALAASATDRQA